MGQLLLVVILCSLSLMAPKRQENTKTWPFLNPAYDSYTNPVAPHEEPYLVSGLNVRTSSRGWLERAPGSVSYEGTPTAVNAWKRTFVYRKWNGDTFVMANEVTATVSRVYKLKVGTDTTFQSLYTSTPATSQGPTSPPTANIYKSAIVGAIQWTGITNVSASDDTRATATLDRTVPDVSDRINTTNYGFTVPYDATVTGVTVEVERHSAGADTVLDLEVRLLKATALVGSDKSSGTNWPTTDTIATYGGSSDLWGTTWTPDEINASGFGFAIRCQAIVSGGGTATPRIDHIRVTVHFSVTVNPFDFEVANDSLYYSNGYESRTYNGTAETRWGIVAPTAVATMTNAGAGITATSGWRYVYCYKNSGKGHISSPSPVSASTGAITDDTITVTVTGSTDTQVDRIRIYRSTDGGNGIFFFVAEITNVSGTTTTYDDTTADTSLDTQFSQQAPPINYNDQAPAMRGLRVFANRIWGFRGNTLYYSGWEEINAGLEEESFPSGVTGNEWTAPQEIMASATLGGQEAKALLVFCRSKTFIVTGDSRDTFSFQELFSNVGSHVKVTGVAEDGDRVFFMGNDNRIYSTNGVSKTLVSEAITDDILQIASTECSMVVHRYGEANWLVVADAGGSTAAVVATSATSPGTAASVAGSKVDWSNPNNALVSDDSRATAALDFGIVDFESSDSLRLTNFGFAIPSTATITGILVEVEGRKNSAAAQGSTVTLVNAAATIGSSITGSIFLNGSDSYISYGGSGNTFGYQLTPTVVNSSTFGIDFVANIALSTTTVSVDHARITVYYTLATGPRWYVLDLTTGKWEPPWVKSATHLFSGETSTGNFVLLYASYDAASNTIIRKLSISPETAAWTEANGGQGSYQANAVFSLTELAPPGKVFEATKLTYHRNDTGSPTAPTIRANFDEVNSGVTWANETALTQNDPTLRTQGTVLVEKQAHFNNSGRNLLVRFEYAGENLNFKTLTLTLHHKEVGPLS